MKLHFSLSNGRPFTSFTFTTQPIQRCHSLRVFVHGAGDFEGITKYHQVTRRYHLGVVKVTSAIAHRAPIVEDLWTLVPWSLKSVLVTITKTKQEKKSDYSAHRWSDLVLHLARMRHSRRRLRVRNSAAM